MVGIKSSKRSAWVAFFFWVGLAGAGFILTFGFEGEIANYRYGPAGWPRALFIGILIVAIAQLVFDLRRANNKRDAFQTVTNKGDQDVPQPFFGLPLKTIVVPVLYILLITPVGFFVATPFFLAGVMLTMGERRWKHIIAVTALIYCLIILVFIKLLYVPLPIGTLPGFYDIGNFLLVAIR